MKKLKYDDRLVSDEKFQVPCLFVFLESDLNWFVAHQTVAAKNAAKRRLEIMATFFFLLSWEIESGQAHVMEN